MTRYSQLEVGQLDLTPTRLSGSPVPFLLASVGTLGFLCLFVCLILERKVTVGCGLCACAVWLSFLGSMSLSRRLKKRLSARLTLVGMFGLLSCLAVSLYLFAYPEISLSKYSYTSEIDLLYSSHDSVRYIIWAERVADLWLGGGSAEDANMALSQIGLPLLYGVLFVIFGFDPVIAVIFNCLMVGLAAVLTFELAADYGEASKARPDDTPLISSLLVFMFPLVPIHGAAIPMKEAVILFLLMLGVVSAEKVSRRLSFLGMFGLVGAFLGLIDMRFYMLVPLVAYAIIRLRRYFVGSGLHSFFFWIFFLVAGVIVGLRFSSSTVSGVVAGESDQIRDYLAGYEEAGSITATTFWRGDWSRVYLVPFRAFLIPFNPIPPIIFEDYHVGAESANVIFLVLLMPFMLERFYQVVKQGKYERLAYLIPVVVGLLVISASLQVCSPRFVMPLLPFLAILTAQGIVYCPRDWRGFYFPLLLLICFCAAASYIALKAIVSIY